jgi:mycofactocin system glycosyltransferase
LPPGFAVSLDPSVRRFGNVLIGGEPVRALRLTPAGIEIFEALAANGEVPQAGRGLAHRLVDAGLAHPRPARASAHARVIVAIPVRDRPQQLETCLEALGDAAPTLVVDDGSIDAEAVAAVAARHGARLLRRERPGGPAAARNTALRHVDHELVAFIDSDCTAPPDWIDRLAGHFDDPQVGAVAPRVSPHPAPRSASLVERFIECRSPIDLGPAESAVQPGGRVAYVPTAALLVRREAVAAGFDPALRYGEDVDLVWRLHDAGWRVRYDPAVIVRHAEPRTWRALLGRRIRYGTSAAPLARRHPGRLAPVRLRPAPTLVAALALACRPGQAAVAVAVQGMLLHGRIRRLGMPRRLGLRWAAESSAWTVVSLGHAATILALPALALGLTHRRSRAGAAVLLLASPLVEYRRRRPAIDPARWALACIVDDAAYGIGVWRGCAAERTCEPALPRRLRT